jgi:hypothetical protein
MGDFLGDLASGNVGGAVSDLGDAASDAASGLADAVGKAWKAVSDGVAHAASDFGDIISGPLKGPGGFLNAIVTAGGLLVEWVSGVQIPVLLAGYVAGAVANALIRTRSPTQAEYDWVNRVFDGTLPDIGRIVITDMTGLGGRPFSVPNPVGQFVMNLGPGYDDPVHYNRNNGGPGRLFVHEATHVWQIHNSSFLPGLLCEGVWNQVQYNFGKNVYDYGDGSQQFSRYNLEQQAALIDTWYANGMNYYDPFYRFVEFNIRAGSPSAYSYNRYQAGWRWCSKCQGLFFGGPATTGGACPKGGAHDGGGSGTYCLLWRPGAGADAQPGWRWCRNCQGLFYAGSSPVSGVCPAVDARRAHVEWLMHRFDFAGVHIHPSGSYVRTGRFNQPDELPFRAHYGGASAGYFVGFHQDSYTIRVPTWPVPFSVTIDPDAGGQENWRWCRRCQGLFYIGNGGHGVCPLGGAHDPGSSGPYVLWTLDSA